MPSRPDLVEELRALVGLDVLQIEDAKNGWPALVKIVLGDVDR